MGNSLQLHRSALGRQTRRGRNIGSHRSSYRVTMCSYPPSRRGSSPHRRRLLPLPCNRPSFRNSGLDPSAAAGKSWATPLGRKHIHRSSHQSCCTPKWCSSHHLLRARDSTETPDLGKSRDRRPLLALLEWVRKGLQDQLEGTHHHRRSPLDPRPHGAHSSRTQFPPERTQARRDTFVPCRRIPGAHRNGRQNRRGMRPVRANLSHRAPCGAAKQPLALAPSERPP